MKRLFSRILSSAITAFTTRTRTSTHATFSDAMNAGKVGFARGKWARVSCLVTSQADGSCKLTAKDQFSLRGWNPELYPQVA